MIKTVIFDMDGLMFDTERLTGDAWLQVGSRHGLPITKTLLDRMRGLPLDACVRIFKEELGEDFDYWTLRKERVAYVDQWILDHGMPIKPGLKNLLGWLWRHEYCIALATSTYQAAADRFLELAGVGAYFQYRVYGDMVKHGKPEPDIFLCAAEKTRTSPYHCLVLEDSYAGVEAGWKAGMAVIMVPDVLLPTEREYERISLCAKTLEDVIPYLQNNRNINRPDNP